MADRLLKLTSEQEALIPAVRDQWIADGLRSEPADRTAAEDGVAAAYRAAGLEPPRIIVWLDSPAAGAIGTTYLQHLLEVLQGQVGGQVGGQVWDQVGGQVWGQVRGQVGGQVWDQVGGQVGDQVRGQVGGQVRDQVGGQVRDQVGGQVGGQVRGQVRGQVPLSLWGQHDAGFLSWCDFWRRIGIRGVEISDGLMAVGRAAGWWWALRGAVVLTERPRYVKLDESGRLHSPDGPAIVYPDGFGVWAWHGMRVDRDLIEKPITLKQIQKDRNTEVRRMLTERYGPERYLQDAGAKLVSQDDWGKLWRLDQPGDEPLVMIEMVNNSPEPDGSFKHYWERVPPATRTPLEGLAWQAELPPDAYARMTVQT